MKTQRFGFMMAGFLVFMLTLATGVWACEKGAMRVSQNDIDEMGLASSGSQYDNEEVAPAVPSPEQGRGEMNPYSFGSQKEEGMTPSSPGSQNEEEMTPASPRSHDEEYTTPKNAPYQAPAPESQPY